MMIRPQMALAFLSDLRRRTAFEQWTWKLHKPFSHVPRGTRREENTKRELRVADGVHKKLAIKLQNGKGLNGSFEKEGII